MNSLASPSAQIIYLDGDAPVQALGSIAGYPFYFHARGDSWRFAVANKRDESHLEAMRVASGQAQGFLLCKRFGPIDGLEASVMRYEVALLIIERCTRAFVAFSKTL